MICSIKSSLSSRRNFTWTSDPSAVSPTRIRPGPATCDTLLLPPKRDSWTHLHPDSHDSLSALGRPGHDAIVKHAPADGNSGQCLVPSLLCTVNQRLSARAIFIRSSPGHRANNPIQSTGYFTTRLSESTLESPLQPSRPNSQ